jgi:hypothetical protein
MLPGSSAQSRKQRDLPALLRSQPIYLRFTSRRLEHY